MSVSALRYIAYSLNTHTFAESILVECMDVQAEKYGSSQLRVLKDVRTYLIPLSRTVLTAR